MVAGCVVGVVMISCIPLWLRKVLMNIITTQRKLTAYLTTGSLSLKDHLIINIYE